MELVHLDFLSIEPSKGNIENVLVITDHFTRYAQAYASKHRQHKLQLSYCGKFLLGIMASQRNSYLIRAETLKVN